jgi:protein O-GlcNAc transferase
MTVISIVFVWVIVCMTIGQYLIASVLAQPLNTRLESNINIDTISTDIPTDQIRDIIHYLSSHGRNLDLVNFLNRVERARGSLDLDRKSPPVYSFLGVALYSLKRIDESVEAFNKCIKLFPNDTRPYINLGEIQVQRFQLDEAAEAFKSALRLGEYSALPRIMRTNGWALNWKDWEIFQIDLERLANNCADNLNNCKIDANSGLEYTDASPFAFRVLTAIAPNSQTSLNPIRANKKAVVWKKSLPNRRLKVGFVSSDFGIHPVATLIRGMLQYLDKNRFEVYCFAVNPAMSWWGGNISTAVEHFHIMNEFNLHEAAEYIASFKIEILIDLNGHTMFSGLPIMAFKPAPLQYSFLGLPTTTGTIDLPLTLVLLFD